MATPQPKKVLLVVTAGGFTNAAPLFEIGAILASRGYVVTLGTLSGREKWLKSAPYISETHVLGPSMTPEEEEVAYVRMSDWARNGKLDWEVIVDTKMFMEKTWPAVYKGLSLIMQDPAKRPDFILSDYLVDATHDMMVEYGVPIAMHYCQMPYAMLPASYIPGLPGLQVDVLTSEFATVWQRINNIRVLCKSIPSIYKLNVWRNKMRSKEGVSRPIVMRSKPDCLLLVNSFFGIEAAKDIPPNVAAVGPILSDTVEPLGKPYTEFLKTRSQVVYVALGTHVLFSSDVMFRLISGLLEALSTGTVDGIIWAIRPMARKQLRQTDVVKVPDPEADGTSKPGAPGVEMTVERLMAGAHPSVLFVEYAPQRALIEDERVAVFLSHVGAASTNEAAYAGVPLVTLPAYFDQIQYGMRLRDAGVAVPLDKDIFEAPDVVEALRLIAHDRRRGGAISINVERLRKIARLSSRRKHLAADLIEETLADAEGRKKEGSLMGPKRRLRGFHLQTADGRMSAWKAKNWDLWTLGFVAVTGVLGVVVALPITLGLVL